MPASARTSGERAAVSFRSPGDDRVTALVGAGYIHDKTSHVRDRRFPYYALVYLLAGGGTWSDERGERPVSAGDVLVIIPGVAHGYGCAPGGRWSECFICFQGGLFRHLERDGLLDRAQPVLSPGLDPGLVAAFDALIAGHRAAVAPDDALACARVHLLIAEIAARHRRHAAAADDRLARACALLAERLDQPCDPVRVARRLGMGAQAFRKWFARAAGLPPARWRMHRRIDRAQALLVEEGLSIAAVAERLGYCDQFFFARQFKKVTGETPAAFRAAYRSAGRAGGDQAGQR